LGGGGKGPQNLGATPGKVRCAARGDKNVFKERGARSMRKTKEQDVNERSRARHRSSEDATMSKSPCAIEAAWGGERVTQRVKGGEFFQKGKAGEIGGLGKRRTAAKKRGRQTTIHGTTIKTALLPGEEGSANKIAIRPSGRLTGRFATGGYFFSVEARERSVD